MGEEPLRKMVARPVWLLALTVLIFVLATGQAAKAQSRTFTHELVDSVFPLKDETVGPVTGTPPAAAIHSNGKLAGYVFSTRDVIGSVGYSGKPIDIIVGLGVDGRLTGARLVAHTEPILIIGVTSSALESFVSGFTGLDIIKRAKLNAIGAPRFVSGASVSSAAIRDAIIRSARAVAHARNILPSARTGPKIDRTGFTPLTWPNLIAQQAIAHRRITAGDVAGALGRQGTPMAGSQPDDAVFVDLYTALLTPPGIGQNLIGQAAFTRLVSRLGASDNAILIAANGRYSFKGTAHVRNGVFDRIQIVQGARTIRLTHDGYRNLESLPIEGAPEFREIGVFAVPADTGFDPARPWRLQLAVVRDTAAGGAVSALFEMPYELPGQYIVSGGPEAADFLEPDPVLWQEIWLERRFEILALLALLGLFSAILVFQDLVCRSDRFHRTTRIAFLAVTTVWLGWIAGAQLSVVHVLTFAQALLSGFDWNVFLLDPMAFILWGFVAVALLFWGRGVYCGWLCPFGALQELLNEAARKLRIPQIQIPFAVHERLWPIKYIIFLALFAVSLSSVELAFRGAEVEPFKTAISLKFMRQWPFVLYAVALLGAGLFIERFYCRYLCPLGAALAIPARLRMFEWLKRRYQCGRECKICATNCTVQAIHPDGHINPNECIYCLDCQRTYHDKITCPPLIVREKRRLQREKVAQMTRSPQEPGQ